jgi:hypothetical protein
VFVNEPSRGLLWELEELIRTGGKERSILVNYSPPKYKLPESLSELQNLRSEPVLEGDAPYRLRERLAKFSHQLDLDAEDLPDKIASLVKSSRARRSNRTVETDLSVLNNILTDSLAVVLTLPIANTIVDVMEEYRKYMEAASTHKDAHELFVSANLVLGLSAAVSNFGVAAYAAECLSVAYAHYARPGISWIGERYRPKVLDHSEKLSQMSGIYLSWCDGDQVDRAAFRNMIRARHGP